MSAGLVTCLHVSRVKLNNLGQRNSGAIMSKQMGLVTCLTVMSYSVNKFLLHKIFATSSDRRTGDLSIYASIKERNPSFRRETAYGLK